MPAKNMRTRAKSMKAAMRRKLALEMRIAGMSIRAIYDEMRRKEEEGTLDFPLPPSYTYRRVSNDIEYVRKEMEVERHQLAEQYVTLTMERYERMFMPFYLKAVQGDADAAEMALKIHEKQVKLLRLDELIKQADEAPSAQGLNEAADDMIVAQFKLAALLGLDPCQLPPAPQPLTVTTTSPPLPEPSS